MSNHLEPTGQRPLLTIEELAAWLRVNESTVRDWMRSGALPHLRFGSRVVRFDPDEVLSAIRCWGNEEGAR